MTLSLRLGAQNFYDTESYVYEPINLHEDVYWDYLHAPVWRDSCNFYAPNSFTPNGDGVNDVWKVLVNDCPIIRYECKVYDRYGSLVWESFDPSEIWIGDVNLGSYYAMTDIYKYIIHITGSGWSNTYRGHITLVR